MLSFCTSRHGFCLTLIFLFQVGGSLTPTRLRVEYISNPLGIDVGNPRFSWALSTTSNDHTASQSAYQIVVTSAGKTIVNSQKVTSNKTTNIEIQSQPFVVSNTDYSWTLQVWDNTGKASAMVTAKFGSGLLKQSDWTGSMWLGISKSSDGHLFRKGFSVSFKVASARCYVASPNYYKIYMNGQTIDPDRALGAFTTFEKRVLYDTFDCKEYIETGSNAVGISLGNGWYSQATVNVGVPIVRVQIRIAGTGGESMIVNSDGTWKQHIGPVTMNDIYKGENYDGRLEVPGWYLAQFDDSSWHAASVISSPKIGMMSSGAVMPMARKVESYTPLSITQPRPGVFVFDFGQNVAGISKIRIPPNNARGRTVTITHSEQLNPDGTVANIYGTRTPMVGNYTMKGDGTEEVYEAQFTYFGFQYAQVTGFPGTPAQNSITSYFIHTAFDSMGSVVFGSTTGVPLSNSSKLLNAVQHATRYASMSNYISIPTDCPQRERRGWLGDAQISAETTIHNFDMPSSYTKFLEDIRLEQIFQNKKGALPDVVPYYHHGAIPGHPAWTTAYILIVGWMYDYFDDIRLINRHYDGMTAQIDFMTTLVSNAGVIPKQHPYYGDWCAASGGCSHPSAVTNTFYYALQLARMIQFARLTNRTSDVQKYTPMHTSALNAINKNFLDTNAGYYKNPTGNLVEQTLQSLPLTLGIVPGGSVKATIDFLAKDITDTNKNHMITGIVGTKYLLPVLCRYGRCDLALDLVLQTSEPSYGFWINQGATTLWENWSSSRFHASGSKNHIMFGGQGSWYYQYIAGIRQVAGSNNWKRIMFDPYYDAMKVGVSQVSASVDTMVGEVSIIWQSLPDYLCSQVQEHELLTLSCPGSVIKSIDFASFGTPTGSCGAYKKSSCDSKNSLSVVEKACVGKSKCQVKAEVSTFGGDPCHNVFKRLSVQAVCSKPTTAQVRVAVPVGSVGVVRVLVGTTGSVFEAGSPVWVNEKFVPQAGVVSAHRVNPNAVQFATQSGRFDFVVQG